MEILRSADVPSDRRAREFRYSRFRAGTGATILAVAALALIGFGRLNNTWIPYYIAGVIIVTLLIFHNLVTARFRPTNWLVRMTDDGLFIKFRSYLNCRFSDQDPTVVLIADTQIRSAKLVK
jgi:fatty acid desaturase